MEETQIDALNQDIEALGEETPSDELVIDEVLAEEVAE